MNSRVTLFSSRASGGNYANCRRGRQASNRGIALMITLILLALLGAASLAVVLLVSTDTMINGLYRNYRGSFYAADSGINIVVESTKSAILAAATDNVNPPLPSGAPPSSITGGYTPFQSAYYTIGDTNSWAGKFKMVANPGGTAVLGAPTVSNIQNPADPKNAADLIWTFTYPYTITVQGQSSGSEVEQITETGTINYTSTTGAASAGAPPAFSKWAAFITNFADCQGPLVPGTMTGPFFTDGQWNFGNFSNPGYNFTGSIQQAGANASWWKNNSCTDATTPPKGFTQPKFPAGGLQLGVAPIQPPTDSYGQAQAVLDGKGGENCGTPPCPLSQTQMNQELMTVSGTHYPATGSAPTGVYIPYYTSGTSPSGQACSSANPCYGSTGSGGAGGYAGGFYIQGNASITLTATTTGSGSGAHPTQTYTITQGSTTTTILVDNVLGQTTVTSGSSTQVLQGVPTQLDPTAGTVMNNTEGVNSNAVNPTLIYVNGSITGLTGTYDSSNNALPAVQNDTGVTIVASSDISITGDLTYANSPVSIPADTLNSSTNAGVLGIYTTKNINLNPDPKGNLTVDGSLAALSGNTGSSATSGFETPGSGITNWTIVGGRSEDQAHGVNIGSGNTYYDQRFAGDFGPPWFPTAVPQPGQAAVPTSQSVTVTRSTWTELNRQ